MYSILKRSIFIGHATTKSLTHTESLPTPLQLQELDLHPTTTTARLQNSLAYDILFNRSEALSFIGKQELRRLTQLQKDKLSARFGLNSILQPHYFEKNRLNTRHANIFARLYETKKQLTNTLAGLGRSKNSCFLLGKSRTYNRKLAFARHSIRKSTAFGYINGLRRI
jgi:ribosomal protein S14